jgi:hypothetical protein
LKQLKSNVAFTITTIRSNTGPAPEINIKAGVKHGFPLSPITFNLKIETILHAVCHTGRIKTSSGGHTLAPVCGRPSACCSDARWSARLFDVTGRVADGQDWDSEPSNGQPSTSTDK